MTDQSKSQSVPVRCERIPQYLTALPQWVLWRWEQRPDRTTGELKWTKPPYQPNGQHAECDNPSTWTTFAESVAAYHKGGFAGIGIVVTHDDDLAGVDLDHCVDPESGAVAPWAMNLVQTLNSYTEISPSGTGLRVFLKAKLPPKDRKIGHFECYESGRYLTVTGNHFDGTPTTVEHRQAEMEAVHIEVFAERNKHRANSKVFTASELPQLDDQELLNKAFNARNGSKFSRLFHGDMSGYNSHSEADLALCSLLAFYTGPDPQKIDRIYRASDMVSRKWDDPRGDSTWGLNTIYKALEGRTEFYSNGHGERDHHSGESSSTATDDDDWSDREPLRDKATAPSLSADMVPEPLRSWLLDIARQGSFPLEMVAAPAIVGISSIIGRKLAIRPWQFSDYVVVPNLWGCIVARPSVMKSHAIDRAINPLKRLAATAHDRFIAADSLAEADSITLEAEIEAVKKEIKKAAEKGGKVMDALKAKLVAKLQERDKVRPSERRYWVSDSTPEMLADLLKQNQNGLLVCYDELAGWLGEMEKPGREGSRAFYLSAWERTGSHYVDRIQRGSNYIPAVCLSVIGSIQPDRLRCHIEEAISGHRGGDGMLQRFQIMIYLDRLGEWKSPDTWRDTAARQRAYDLFRWLNEADLGALGTVGDDGELPYVRFTPDVQQLADLWREELEIRTRGDELREMPAFEAHLGKYRSLMPSLALVFHLIKETVETVNPIYKENPRKISSVSREAVELAADWCDFLEQHAQVIYQAEVSPGKEAAHRLAERLTKGSIRHGEPIRDIYRHKWTGLTTHSQVAAGLEVLEAAGWVRIVTQPTGANPTTLIHVHPELRGS